LHALSSAGLERRLSKAMLRLEASKYQSFNWLIINAKIVYSIINQTISSIGAFDVC
jgi:hypothetical protein